MQESYFGDIQKVPGGGGVITKLVVKGTTDDGSTNLIEGYDVNNDLVFVVDTDGRLT